jgi:hypothetical protein
MLFGVYTLFLSFKEDSVQNSKQLVQFPCNRPDAQLSKHHPSGRRELSVWTFLYVEKLRTAPACIRLDVSAARLFITVIHHPFARRRVHDSFSSPRSVFRLSSFREPSTLPVFFLVGVAFSFFMSSRYFRNSIICQPPLQTYVLLS